MEDLIYKPGDRIGNYEVLEFIGGGGFCAVYKVRDLKDDAKAGPSALKICRFDFRTVPRELRVELNARMWREHDELTQLDHQNIVRLYEWGLHDGKVWFAMELLKGPTLGRYLAEERRTYLEVMLTYRQLVEAVAHCHDNGVVHRDLKPSNIIVTRQRASVVRLDEEDRSGGPDRRTPSERLQTRLAVLFDFGIGHMVGAAPVTSPGSLLGTVEYLPPWYVREFLAGRDGKRPEKAYKAEPRDDVYQMAVVLYSQLTGMLPTRTPSNQRLQLLEEIRDVMPLHPREVNPEAPEALSELVMRCLDKSGATLPPDGAAFRVALLEALHRDGEALRRKTPVFLAGQETQLSQAQPASPPPVAAPAPQPTVSAPANVLAEAAALTPVAGAVKAGGGPMSVFPTVSQQPSSPRNSAAEELPELKHLILRLARRAVVVAGAVFVVVVALFYRAETRARHSDERSDRLEAAQEKSAVVLGQVAHAVQSVAAAQASEPPPVAAVPPPAPRHSNLLGGLKMPDRPEPTWLRPDKDGVCRNQKTGEELRTQAVIRGSCWFVGRKMDGDASCPSNHYDPPPEVLKNKKLKDLHESCFSPWLLDGGSSLKPQP